MIKVDDLLVYRNILDYSISDSLKDNLYIVDILGEPNFDVTNNIFVCTHDDKAEWYADKFNRNVLINRLSRRYPEWIFIIDTASFIQKLDINYILVDSISTYFNNIIKDIQKMHKSTVIGITGSVGKSSTVNLLFNNLADSQKIICKRLTPLIIWDFYLNKLKENTRYIIAEIGLYYRKQIQILSEILNPQIAVILSIYDMHLVWNGINSKEELLKEKLNIFNAAEKKLLPVELFNTYRNLILKIFRIDELILILKNNGIPLEIINTKLSKVQINIVKNILSLIGCNNIEYFSITDFKVLNIVNKTCEIFIDNHCSLPGYFQAISEHYYDNVCLVIISLNLVNEETRKSIDLIGDTFQMYKKVIINKKLKAIFRSITIENVTYCSEGRILQNISEFDQIIIHDPDKYFTYKLNLT